MGSPVTSLRPAKPVGYAALLGGNPDFRNLWLGQIVSLFGDWFTFVASATLVAELTGSGLAVGGLFVARMLPPFLVSPVAGVVADRVDRRRLLIATDLIRAVLVLGFLLVRQPAQVWLLYALTALQLAASGFFFPARNAILPALVRDHELGTANALSATTWSVMLALGAAAGGAAAGAFGPRPAFVIDSLSYLASAALLARIGADVRPDTGGDRSLRGALTQYADGLRYLARHREVLFIALHKAAFALTMGGALQVIQVTLAQRRFVIGEGGGTALGLMYAVAGVGTGIGPLLAHRLSRDRVPSLRRAILAAYLLTAAGLAVMAPLASFALVLLGIFVRGLGGGINWVATTHLLMRLVPDRVRGRVFATEFGLFTLAQATSTAVGGWALDHAGLSLSAMLLVLVAALLVPAILWAVWLARHPGCAEVDSPVAD